MLSRHGRWNRNRSPARNGRAPHITTASLRTWRGLSELKLQASVLGYSIDQRFYSWIDTQQLVTRRFGKDEPGRPREYEIFPEERRVHQIQNKDTTWTLPGPNPLDDLSFVYFARTIPLEVGMEHTFDRYF